MYTYRWHTSVKSSSWSALISPGCSRSFIIILIKITPHRMKDEWEWVGRFRVPAKANQYSYNWRRLILRHQIYYGRRRCCSARTLTDKINRQVPAVSDTMSCTISPLTLGRSAILMQLSCDVPRCCSCWLDGVGFAEILINDDWSIW